MDHPDNQTDTQADNEPATWLTFMELAVARGISKASAVSLVRRHAWRRQRDNTGRVRALVPAGWAAPQPDKQANSQPEAEPHRQTDIPPHTEPDMQTDTARAFEGAIAALTAAHASEIATLRDAHVADLALAREARAGEWARLEAAVAEANQRADLDRAEVEALKAAHASERTRVEAGLATLEARLRTAETERIAAESRADNERARADHAQARTDTAHARADLAEARAEAERDKATAADQRAVKAEADRDGLLASHNRALMEVEGLRTADRARRSAGRLARIRAAWRGE